MKMDHPYLLAWLKIALITLRDVGLFDSMAEKLGRSDENMTQLRDALENFLGDEFDSERQQGGPP